MFSNIFKRKNYIGINEYLLAVSRALSFQRPELHEFFNLYLTNKTTFIEKYSNLNELSGVDISTYPITDAVFDEDEANEVFRNLYQDSGYVIVTDYKEDFEILKEYIDKLLLLLDIKDFDWTVTDEVYNNPYAYNLFSELAPKFKKYGYTLIYLDIGDESNCAIIKTEELDSILKLKAKNCFEVKQW